MSGGMVPLPVLPAKSASPNYCQLPSKLFACHIYKFALPPVLYLSLIRKHPGCGLTLPIVVHPERFVRREFVTFTHCKQLTSSKCTGPIIAPTTPLESALIEMLIPGSLKLFGMNTYKKQWGRELLLLTRNPGKDFCPQPQSGAQGFLALQSPVTNHQPARRDGSPLTFNCELSIEDPERVGTVDLFSRAVGRINADVFRREVAGPIAGGRASGAQVHDNREVFSEEAVARGALVEIERLAAAENRDSGHGDVHPRGIERYAAPARGGEDASPVGIAPCEGRLHQRGSRNGFGDAARCGFTLGATDLDLHHTLSAFAVGTNLKRERAADVFERGRERAMCAAARANRGSFGGAIRQHEQSVVRGRVAIHADGVERARGHIPQRLLQQGRRDGGVRRDKRQHRRHIRMDHACAFGAAHQMNPFPRHLERSGRGFGTCVRRADRERQLSEGARRGTPVPRN